MLTLLFASVGRAVVIGDFVRVGYPSVGGQAEGRDLIRNGAWVPIVVDLSVQGEASFDGWIRAAQPDKDGDLCYDMQRVQLMPDAGVRQYTLYVPANVVGHSARAISVTLLDDQGGLADLESRGERVKELIPNLPPETLTANDYLILSLSKTATGAVSKLRSLELADLFAKTMHVSHLSPSDVPSQWIGLEIVDAIVWDDADPSDLTAAQLNALLDWTRNGGMLVVAAGRTSDTLAGAPELRDALPATVGPVYLRSRFPILRRNLLGIDNEKGLDYKKPVTAAQCSVKPDADIVLTEKAHEDQPAIDLITRRRLDRGRIVFVAASIRDLFQDGGQAEKFFKRTLELRQPKVTVSSGMSEPLLKHIDGWIGFSQVGALYLGTAMVAAFLYASVATFGAWHFLGRRVWRRHSWTVFAATAIVFNILTVMGVQIVRGGIGQRLIQLAVIDGTAGESRGLATAYFGLKTSLFDVFNVWSPPDYPQVISPTATSCALRPFAAPSDMISESTFINPKRYKLAPSRAELIDVPIRGTVKQFEARWSGSLNGRLEADLSIETDPEQKYDVRITQGSTITNRLGVDFERAFLVYTTQDVFVGRGSNDNFNRAAFTYFFELPPIDDGQTILPRRWLYRDATGSPLSFDVWNRSADLDVRMKGWGASFGTFGAIGSGDTGRFENHEKAILLATFFSEYAPKDGTNVLTPTLMTDGLRQLDISHFLDKGNALLIGFAREPGPIHLCTGDGEEYDATVPSETLTIYRIQIPLTRNQAPPATSGRGQDS